jgi:predicted alpha/beta hydrolase family esterase
MSRIFLIHGWTGRPTKDFFPWAKETLEKEGYEVFVPEMPDPDYPKIKPWVEKIKEVVGMPRTDDIFIGHSLGCMGILQYLQTLPDDTKIKKVILIAGFEKLKEAAFEALEDWDTFKPWGKATFNYKKVKKMAKSWIALFSDDDPFVSYKVNSKIFKEKLSAKIILQHGMSHFNQEQGIRTLPILLELVKQS